MKNQLTFILIVIILISLVVATIGSGFEVGDVSECENGFGILTYDNSWRCAEFSDIVDYYEINATHISQLDINSTNISTLRLGLNNTYVDDYGEINHDFKYLRLDGGNSPTYEIDWNNQDVLNMDDLDVVSLSVNGWELYEYLSNGLRLEGTWYPNYIISFGDIYTFDNIGVRGNLHLNGNLIINGSVGNNTHRYTWDELNQSSVDVNNTELNLNITTGNSKLYSNGVTWFLV